MEALQNHPEEWQKRLLKILEKSATDNYLDDYVVRPFIFNNNRAVNHFGWHLVDQYLPKSLVYKIWKAVMECQPHQTKKVLVLQHSVASPTAMKYFAKSCLPKLNLYSGLFDFSMGYVFAHTNKKIKRKLYHLIATYFQQNPLGGLVTLSYLPHKISGENIH